MEGKLLGTKILQFFFFFFFFFFFGGGGGGGLTRDTVCSSCDFRLLL